MSAESEDKLRDVVAWYFGNKERIPKDNLAKRCDFYEKAICCMLEVMAMQARDMQIMEQRSPRNRLWLPTGVRLDNEPPVKLDFGR